MGKKLKLSSPWVCYAAQVRALFGQDPDVKIVFDNDSVALKLYVQGAKKAAAIEELLPSEKTFGNVTLTITIIPDNKKLDSANTYTVEDAFTGNPIFSFARYIPDAFLSNGMYFIVFRKEVLQWYNDSLGDLFGNTSDLAENVAREILDTEPNVFFCTDIK